MSSKSWKSRKNAQIKASKKIRVYTKSKGVCAHCGKPLNLKRYQREGRSTIEHIIQRSLKTGGYSEVKNLCVLCNDCNNLKGGGQTCFTFGLLLLFR